MDASSPDDVDIAVLAEDQENINQFSCLNQRLQELKADCDSSAEEIQRLKDAEEEVLICVDSDSVMLAFGDCFIPSTDNAAMEYIAVRRAAEDEKTRNYAEEISSIQTQMNVLKSKLYGKFGKVINLDP